MAHFKRKRPKEHRHIDCCIMESWYDSGNARWRIPVRDLRQPQFNTSGKAAHRYHKIIEY